MRIVIIGGGGVGQALAGILAEENHDVTLVEANATRASAAAEELDCRVIHGSGIAPHQLREAGAERADIFVAASDRDEVNILACSMARRLGCRLTVARVSEPAFTEGDNCLPLSEMGVDQVINPDQEAGWEILRLLEAPGTSEVIPLVGGAISVAGMFISEHSPLAGASLASLGSQAQWRVCRVVTIRRGEETIIPTGDDRIELHDEVFVIGPPRDVQAIAKLASAGEKTRLARVMILGANDIGQNVAQVLQDRARVTLMDMGGQYATAAAAKLQRALVITGDGQEMDLLEREDLAAMDALVAVDDDEELNLIACLLARRLGVPKTVARVERKNYRPLVKTIGIDATVSARLATVNAILKYIRTGDIKAVARMRGVAAEAIELQPRPRSKVLNKPLRDIRFPPGALVGAVVRAEGVTVPSGDTVISEGDRVVIFALEHAIAKVEKMFS